MSKSEELYRRDAKVLSNILKLRFNPFVAKRGEGILLYDAEGKKYIDFSASWGVMNTGYNHPRIIKAVTEQMNRLSFATNCSIMTEESILLAEHLTELLPGDFEKKVWYGHSGSDANEFISKIVPLATGRPRILTFVGAYHGQTMGSYAMSGHPAQSRFIGGGNVTKIPYPYCYRCAFEKDPENCGLFCLKYLEDYIFKSVTYPEQVGAIVVEAIQCDGGDVVPPDGFLNRLEEICRMHGIYLIIDEVKIGYGRTGKMFGFENSGVVPDAVIMGKPMGSGQPLSAVVGRKELMDAGVGMHLFTTAGNPVACAAGIETIKIIQDEALAENAERIGNYLIAALREMAKKYEIIGDVRGKGLVIGVELVKAGKEKEPADDLAAMIVYRAYELGLILYSAGIFSNVLEMTPPLTLTKEQADEALSILQQAFDDVLEGRFDKNKLTEFAGWSS